MTPIRMKTILMVVGKTDDPLARSQMDEYGKRLMRYIPYELVTLPDVKNSKNMPESLQKEKEGALILEQLLPGDWVTLLDERGRQCSSVEFADYMAQRMQSGQKRLVFVIGGPYGFDASVYARANDKLSLSRMTFSHQMVRMIFTEQLYRAMTILKGEPYHHG